MRILFQGDSITDGDRDRRNYYDMGNSYPKYAKEEIVKAFPNVDIEFINLGIGGNRTGQLFDRLYPDGISLMPDIFSILIGINDIWHRYGNSKISTSDEQIELNYRSILERIKKDTNAKIVMLAPYVLDAPGKDFLREGLVTVAPIIRKLAEEYADVFIPLDEKFAAALETQPEALFYSRDGAHLNNNGAAFVGKLYAEAVVPLIKELFDHN